MMSAGIRAVAAALLAVACVLAAPLAAWAHDLPDGALDLTAKPRFALLSARSSSPTGQWVTVHSYQWGNHYRTRSTCFRPRPTRTAACM